jgi:transcriptional regulator with XRE-family HTH domain
MKLGKTIHEIRKQKNLTLKDVARMTNLTESLLSQIENDRAKPSITTLIAVSKALNTPIAYFFNQKESQFQSPVVRFSERPVVKTKSGITYYLLNPNREDSPLEVLCVEYEKGATTEKLHTHGGYEYGIVLEGKLEVQVKEDRYILNKGDSITISSSQPHNKVNIYEGTTVAIWVNTPPTF